MAGFNFDLQKVLDVRNIQEDMAQNKYLQARQKKKELERELQQMNQTKHQVYNYLRKDEDNSVEKTIQARQYLQRHKKKINKHQEQLKYQNYEVEQKQEKLIKKQKNRKVLDKLKEKEYKEYHSDLMKAQQKLLDEIGQTQQEVRE